MFGLTNNRALNLTIMATSASFIMSRPGHGHLALQNVADIRYVFRAANEPSRSFIVPGLLLVENAY